MKIKLDSPVEEVQIQIIPLIDVIFCVLTFFILAALQFTRQQSINVDLPKANTGAAPQIRQMLIVTVDPTGQIFVEKEQVTRQRLYQVLQHYHSSNPTGLLVLNASRSTTYNNVVQVLDLLRQVGGDRVALATLPTGQAPGSTSSPGTSP